MRVDAYRNLRKPGVMYSIRHKGKVTHHQPHVVMQVCRMKHASHKQLTAVRTGARQVCQWVSGELMTENFSLPIHGWRMMSCDPKKHDGFVDLLTSKRIDNATYVVLMATGATWYLQRDTPIG